MLKQLFRTMRKSRVAEFNEAGIAAWHRGDLAAAEAHFRKALADDPAFAPAYGNLGMIVFEQRRMEEGLALLREGVALDPANLGTRVNLANALVIGNCHEEAIGHYREVLRRKPDHTLAAANVLKPLLDVCDWEAADSLTSTLVTRWRSGEREVLDAITPFASLLVDVPQAMRLAVAQRYSERVESRAGKPLSAPREGARGRRLRIGYLSADFHNHATAHLMAGLFEHHDRGRFEVHAYSLGVDDGSDYRNRVVAAFEHFHDVRPLPHADIASRIAADGIDLLVDLKGYTGESRPEILALRPAPVQVNYLGYPGTMAARFVDAIIADEIVIPRGEEAGYVEQVWRMPDSYQANDDRQGIDPGAPRREEVGLPANAFVFVCFNKHHKIERPAFESWMRILGAVPNSVLWLMGGHGERALARHAAGLGVDPGRLVFSGKLPKARHLARHACADLFLDTWTYNAHTTASDALWAGLPLVTLPGSAFASRVAASLLAAVGLPELIARDAQDYERIAVRLATHPQELRALRDRLAANRRTMPLFDTASFTADIESLYLDLWRAHGDRGRRAADAALGA